MRLFRNDFQRNVQHSIHTSDITKRNSNVHFILGNTVHAWPGLTVNRVRDYFEGTIPLYCPRFSGSEKLGASRNGRMERNFPVIPIFRNFRPTSRGTPKISEWNSGKCLFHSLPNPEFPEFLVEWKAPYVPRRERPSRSRTHLVKQDLVHVLGVGAKGPYYPVVNRPKKLNKFKVKFF